MVGDNTDGVGLLRDIMINLRYPIKGKRVLLLGAGGASRGVVGPLLGELPESLTVANRTVPRARSLAEHFASVGPVTGCGYDELAGRVFDIVINATSASLSGTMPPLPEGIFALGSLAYKMMYGMGDTPFRAFAREQGVGLFSEGLGMPLEQAAESFFLWRGVRPIVAYVRSPGKGMSGSPKGAASVVASWTRRLLLGLFGLVLLYQLWLFGWVVPWNWLTRT